MPLAIVYVTSAAHAVPASDVTVATVTSLAGIKINELKSIKTQDQMR